MSDLHASIKFVFAAFLILAGCAASPHAASVESQVIVYEEVFADADFAEFSQRLQEFAAGTANEPHGSPMEVMELEPAQIVFVWDLAPLLKEGEKNTLNEVPRAIPASVMTRWVFEFGELGGFVHCFRLVRKRRCTSAFIDEFNNRFHRTLPGRGSGH